MFNNRLLLSDVINYGRGIRNSYLELISKDRVYFYITNFRKRF